MPTGVPAAVAALNHQRLGPRGSLRRYSQPVATLRMGRSAGPFAVLGRRREAVRRWWAEDERALQASLLLLTLVSAVAMYQFPGGMVPPGVLVIPLMIGSLTLSPSRIPRLVAVIWLVLAGETSLEALLLDEPIPRTHWVPAAMVVAMGMFSLVIASGRDQLGVGGLRGGSMLIDLKERLSRQGTLPELPAPWYAEVEIRPAGGSSFAGDFLVARRHEQQGLLSVVLVDVSGKGVGAGTRSLMLSGALGGLLGAVPPASFLPAANEFLVEQSWDEGFATAVQLTVDLHSGAFELRSAGHPPAAHFRASAGRWVVATDATGPVLGLVPGADFEPLTGRLGAGDAILLYTDGLVERSKRDISQGIDRLLGQAERLVSTGFHGAARSLVSRVGATDDDCALVLIHRR